MGFVNLIIDFKSILLFCILLFLTKMILNENCLLSEKLVFG